VVTNLSEGTSKIAERLDRTLVGTAIEIAINVVALSCAALGATHWWDAETAVLITTMVYMGTVMRSAVKALLHLPELATFTEHLVKYRRRGPHTWIAAQIAPEVHQSFDRMGLLERMLGYLAGSPSRERYIELQAAAIVQALTKKVVLLGALFALYVTLFRLLACPILIQDATGFDAFQAFLWPFVFSIDFFLGSDLTSHVRDADYWGLVAHVIGQP
jgi:hypothetical protein